MQLLIVNVAVMKGVSSRHREGPANENARRT